MVKQTDTDGKLAFEPPEPQYIAEKEVFYIALSDERLHKPWELRLYATELVKQKIGDEVQVASIKVKKPRLVRKTLARIKKQEPQAQLVVTVKF